MSGKSQADHIQEHVKRILPLLFSGHVTSLVLLLKRTRSVNYHRMWSRKGIPGQVGGVALCFETPFPPPPHKHTVMIKKSTKIQPCAKIHDFSSKE